jgi:hypothetical protein
MRNELSVGLHSKVGPSQRLLLHLDIEISRSTTAKQLGEIVGALIERIKEKVPTISTIQIEVVSAQ